MLGHYAGPAPLRSLTSEDNRRLPCSAESSSTDTATSSKRTKQPSAVEPSAVQAITAQLASRAAKIDELLTRERVLEQTAESMDERTLSDKHILNIDSSRWHVEAESTGLEPIPFRAACGWRLGGANHHRAKTLTSLSKGQAPLRTVPAAQ